MLFRAYQTLGEAVNTSEGLHTIFVYVNTITNGMFSRLFLFSLFLIIAFGSYLSMKRLDGRGDFAASCSMAGFITAITSVIMSFIPGLVTTFDIIVTISVSIMCVLWLFTSRSSD